MPIRRVQGFAVLGSAVLVLAAVVHGDATMAAYVLPQLGCAVATSNVVSYLKNKQSAASQRFENLLDGIHAYVVEADLEDGTLTFCNQQTVDRIGVVETLGALLRHVHPDDVDLVTRAVE